MREEREEGKKVGGQMTPIHPVDSAFYYTGPSAGERSIHLHGHSRFPVVNFFSIMAVAKHIMTVVKESGFFHVSYRS